FVLVAVRFSIRACYRRLASRNPAMPYLDMNSLPMTKEKEKEDEIVANVNDPDRYWHISIHPQRGRRSPAA
ncbi:MAG: hypothetical protein ACREF9_16750, partial [Opitutaceae bacterium]